MQERKWILSERVILNHIGFMDIGCGAFSKSLSQPIHNWRKDTRHFPVYEFIYVYFMSLSLIALRCFAVSQNDVQDY